MARGGHPPPATLYAAQCRHYPYTFCCYADSMFYYRYRQKIFLCVRTSFNCKTTTDIMNGLYQANSSLTLLSILPEDLPLRILPSFITPPPTSKTDYFRIIFTRRSLEYDLGRLLSRPR
ncbi:uncharacterized protein [Drosophila pseudoobscura]|uniref:Uncharacterized protein n=1 Tax=Drosophila pseudoobscura pseudoobscura TaxID=46245 RepID=A0A6I8VZA3_DROPS|nr:uncharacterized protein LOC26532522 [Drosophila pseudoobscura]